MYQPHNFLTTETQINCVYHQCLQDTQGVRGLGVCDTIVCDTIVCDTIVCDTIVCDTIVF